MCFSTGKFVEDSCPEDVSAIPSLQLSSHYELEEPAGTVQFLACRPLGSLLSYSQRLLSSFLETL